MSKEVIAIIPARGGSKGIPRKNLIDLGAKPLLSWTLESAFKAESVTRVLVSTDDPEIARTSIDLGAECLMRPAELATDHIHAVHVVLHALETLQIDAELVLMLLPTSPFRQAYEIDDAIRTYRQQPDSDSLVSVCELDKQILHLRNIRKGFLVPLAETTNLNIQRQDLEPLYALNGSIYVSTPAKLLKNRSFHTSYTIPYIMPWLHSIDINSLQDLSLAKTLLQEVNQS